MLTSLTYRTVTICEHLKKCVTNKLHATDVSLMYLSVFLLRV